LIFSYAEIGARGLEGVVKLGVAAAAALSAIVAVSAATSGSAQAPPSLPPLPGFVGPYEISRIVRSAGFDPLAPPLREGATYVVRAVDFRGTLMRVVVDGHSGAIRAVNRIVAASEAYGPMEMAPPAYGVPPSYAEPPPEFARPGVVPFRTGAVPDPLPPGPSIAPQSAGRSITSPFPPLPRPRPSELASRKTADEVKPTTGKPAAVSSAPSITAPKKQPATEPLPD
jgi:hypothetical protein